jgi:hypothetical protein
MKAMGDMHSGVEVEAQQAEPALDDPLVRELRLKA